MGLQRVWHDWATFTHSLRQLYGLPGGSAGKESACNAGDTGSIPREGKSPREGNDNSLQYSRLGNPVDTGVYPQGLHKELDMTEWLWLTLICTYITIMQFKYRTFPSLPKISSCPFPVTASPSPVLKLTLFWFLAPHVGFLVLEPHVSITIYMCSLVPGFNVFIFLHIFIPTWFCI